MRNKQTRIAGLSPDEPCHHQGCLQHLTHPCEGCGRIGGKYPDDARGNKEAAPITGTISVNGWCLTDCPYAGRYSELHRKVEPFKVGSSACQECPNYVSQETASKGLPTTVHVTCKAHKTKDNSKS